MFKFLLASFVLFSSLLFPVSPSFALDACGKKVDYRYYYRDCVNPAYEFEVNRLSVFSPWISKMSKYCAVSFRVRPTMSSASLLSPGSFSDSWDILKYNPVFDLHIHHTFLLFYNPSKKLWEVNNFSSNSPGNLFSASGATPLEAFNNVLNKILLAQNAFYLSVKAVLIETHPTIDIRVMLSSDEFFTLYVSHVYSKVKIKVNQRSRLPIHSGHTKVTFNCPTLPNQD